MDLSLGFVTWICLNLNWLLAVTGVMHEAEDAYSMRSTWSCYWLDQFLTLALNILILSIFKISMDLSTNYFAHFSGCWASFVCSCHSILECCVTFSEVKSIRSFVLFIQHNWFLQRGTATSYFSKNTYVIGFFSSSWCFFDQQAILWSSNSKLCPPFVASLYFNNSTPNFRRCFESSTYVDFCEQMNLTEV